MSHLLMGNPVFTAALFTIAKTGKWRYLYRPGRVLKSEILKVWQVFSA